MLDELNNPEKPFNEKLQFCNAMSTKIADINNNTHHTIKEVRELCKKIQSQIKPRENSQNHRTSSNNSNKGNETTEVLFKAALNNVERLLQEMQESNNSPARQKSQKSQKSQTLEKSNENPPQFPSRDYLKQQIKLKLKLVAEIIQNNPDIAESELGTKVKNSDILLAAQNLITKTKQAINTTKFNEDTNKLFSDIILSDILDKFELIKLYKKNNNNTNVYNENLRAVFSIENKLHQHGILTEEDVAVITKFNDMYYTVRKRLIDYSSLKQDRIIEQSSNKAKAPRELDAIIDYYEKRL